MKTRRMFVLLALSLLHLCILCRAEQKPNLVFVFVDDWGFSGEAFRARSDLSDFLCGFVPYRRRFPQPFYPEPNIRRAGEHGFDS